MSVSKFGAIIKTTAAAFGAFVSGNILSDWLRGSSYSSEAPGFVLIVTLAIMVPIVAMIWRLPSVRVAAAAAFAAAFISWWTAAGGGAKGPFTEDQWYLLGGTLIVVGVVLTWRQRIFATVR